MEVTKWLKPSISVSRIGDSASGQAATRVNAEQASHGVVQVKSVIVKGIGKSPVFAAVSEVRAQLHDTARFRARSTSHSVAVHDGCTNIPLAAGKAQETRTILESGVSGPGLLRFVHLDPPGLSRSWKVTGFCLEMFVNEPSSWRLR
jgi:hypothetical protein